MSSRFRTVRIAVAVGAALAAVMVAPGAASATLVDDVVKGVNDTLNGLLGGGDQQPPAPGPASGTAQAEPAPNAGTPPNYVPPAHGEDQHGQGTGATVDLTPTDQLPLPYEPGGGSEDVVVGGSRGSVSGGDYHGHVTILALLGSELIAGADTGEGQTSDGPLGDLNALLGDICTSSGVCLSALAVNSNTQEKSSENSFSAATAGINLGGAQLLDVGVLQSTGTISQAGGCRTATGTSHVADANVAGLTVNAINASSESRACNDDTQSQANDSSVLGLGGAGLPLPAPGCENGTPNTVLEIPLVLALVCNADDGSGTGGVQLQAPYGVREGLTAFVLGATAKVVAAAAESHALAPGRPGGDDDDDDRDGDGIPNDRDECPGQPGPASNDGCPRDGDGGGGDDDEDRDGDAIPDAEDDCPTVPGPASNNGCPFGGGPSGDGPDALAFTGADLATLALIGFAVGGSGLALMALADRRRRRLAASQ